MEDLKAVFAENLSALRKKKGWTQLGLAERLNYSDKAVSKWERGESLPDVIILKQIADLFEVTVDYMLTREHEKAEPLSRKKIRNRFMITAISYVTVWLIACIVYFSLGFVQDAAPGAWLIFLGSVPVSSIVAIVFCAMWWGKKWIFAAISVLIWSILAFTYFLMLTLTGMSLWAVFIIGIPAQIIIGLWSGMKK